MPYQDYEATIVEHLALCPPGVRMAYAYRDPADGVVRLCPVVAIRSSTCSYWRTTTDNGRPGTTTAGGMLGTSRWMPNRGPEWIRDDALIVRPGTNTIATVVDFAQQYPGGELVVLPWPPGEDAERLAPLVEELAGRI